MHRPLAFLAFHFGNRPPWPIPLFPTPTDALSGHLQSSVCLQAAHSQDTPLPPGDSTVHQSAMVIFPISAGTHVHFSPCFTFQYNFISLPPGVRALQPRVPLPRSVLPKHLPLAPYSMQSRFSLTAPLTRNALLSISAYYNVYTDSI